MAADGAGDPAGTGEASGTGAGEACATNAPNSAKTNAVIANMFASFALRCRASFEEKVLGPA